MSLPSIVRRYPLVGVALIVALAGWGLASLDFEVGARVLVSAFALFVGAQQAWGMVRSLMAGQVGLDILAVTAIIATLIIGEYWASLVIVLMLTGGETLEDYAEGRAERELSSLLEHVPQVAHRYRADGTTEDAAASLVLVGDKLLVRPNEIDPVDSTLSSFAAGR